MAVGYGVNTGANGLTANTAAVSARAIKIQFPNSSSGKYWIKNTAVNSGNPFQVYCDMETDGGGWMLIVQNSGVNGGTKMNYTNYSLLNQLTPPTANSRANATSSYSILAWADALKNPNKQFEYMMDANERKSWGGIWIANDKNYMFNQTVNTATNITLKVKFNTWTAYHNDGIEERMPWVAAGNTSNGMLTTSISSNGSWWGTLIEAGSGFTPAPWIAASAGGSGTTANPGVIWYWMRGL